jgi:DNA N-6-adenine-methyltransferase (Dam)
MPESNGNLDSAMDHLQLVNGEYRVRVVVPAALRPVVGKANLTKVLRTADPAKARELAAPVIAKFKTRLSRAASAKARRRRSDDAEWYTPKAVFDAMGVEFDLDVCSPGASAVDWIPAKRHLTKAEDGLARPWSGFVWCNPPHGLRNGMQKWIDKFVEHGNGVIMLPGMTCTKWFHDFAPKARLYAVPAVQAPLYPAKARPQHHARKFPRRDWRERGDGTTECG